MTKTRRKWLGRAAGAVVLAAALWLSSLPGMTWAGGVAHQVEFWWAAKVEHDPVAVFLWEAIHSPPIHPAGSYMTVTLPGGTVVNVPVGPAGGFKSGK